MKKPLFTGVCTALVTPFLNGHINYPMVEVLLQRQIDAGIRTFVIGGTTGESPTLSDEEKLELFSRCKKYVGNDCMIIAGTGSNATEHAVALSRAAQEEGVDALLIVSPYYNKSTPAGLYAHFLSVCHNVHIPVIAYNVPSRTGIDVPVSVYQKLGNIPNIAGVKEASTDITKITKIRHHCGHSFTVWSGNDDQIVPVISLGGLGVISVLSNVLPSETKTLTEAALAGDLDTAAELQTQLHPIIEALFSEVNPIPVKAAMKYMGYDCGECRLPLVSPSQELLKKLKAYLT